MIIFLLSFLVCLVLLGLLAEKRILPLWSWLALLSSALTLSLWLSDIHIVWLILLCLPCWLLVLIIAIPRLRMKFITEPCGQRMQDALSQLAIQPQSQPEWQRDLIVGRLPEIERTVTLNSDERNFLAEQTTLLCQIWQQSLAENGAQQGVPSTKLLDFIMKQGFNRLRLSESSKGRNFSRAAVAAILTRLASYDMRLAQLVASLNGGLSIERYGSGPQQRRYLTTDKNKRCVIYHMSDREVTAGRVYGVIGESNYRQKVKEGIHLYYHHLVIPNFIDLVELIVPCYDPKESSHRQLCFLIPYEMLANKEAPIFVPLSQALLNDSVIPFIQRETSFYTAAFAYASVLNLTHQASTGMAALECLGTKQDLRDLAGLSNELACLDRIQELSLQLLHQGEHLSEADIHTNITDSIGLATMFGMRLSTDHPRLTKALLNISPNSHPPLRLETAVQLHQHWYALYDNTIHQQQREDQLLMDLLARSLRNLLRCWLHGLVWIIQPHHPYRQQRHLVLAYSVIMDIILFNRTLFMSSFPYCDRAWQSMFLVLASQLSSDNTNEWKSMIRKSQREIMILLSSLDIPKYTRFILRWILFPWGNNYGNYSLAEDRLAAEFLMIPSHERQEMFKLLAQQIPYHQQGEELLKLASLVKPIYTELKEKNLSRTMDELGWYEELSKAGHISANDTKIMKDFYLQATAFLADQ